MMKIMQHLVMVLVSLLVLTLPVQGAEQTRIVNIRHWAAPDHTRIVIDTTEDPSFQVEKDSKKISIDLEDAAYSKTLNRHFQLKKPGIDRVIVTPRPDNHVLIELFLTEHTETKIFKLQKVEEKPYRIVVDIELPEVEKKETEERERVKIVLKKKIIVIDPGHGGDDPGAVGRQGTYEKNVVLSISRRIREILNKKEGYRAFLTRDSDYYVPFKKRLKIAREYHADLFMSIHADAEKSRSAAGASVYSLSLRSASSEAARILARNENLADIVGGVANGEATKDASDPIILNMFQTNTMNSSKTFGGLLLRNISAVNRIKFATVQEAPFMVLKLPEVPSVLVETAFISNPREEKMLRNATFQKEIAETIADSAVEFLEQAPGEIPVLAKAKAEEPSKNESEKVTDQKASPRAVPSPQMPLKKKSLVIVYTVKKGDFLERIARKYGTTVAAITELNDIKTKKPLYVNRKLKIPVSFEDETSAPLKKIDPGKKPETFEKKKKLEYSKKEEEKSPSTLYTVKKGESLDIIARKNGTTLAVLLEMNDMKIKDPLYAGRKVKIPASAKEETTETREEEKGRETKEAISGKRPSVYVVKKNDTLEGIAKKHGISLQALLRLNKIKIGDSLHAGRTIRLSEPIRDDKAANKFYIVKKGDTLETIARKNKTTIAGLRKLNGKKKLSPLYVDQKLEIPGR